MLYSIEQSIAESLARIKPTRSIWKTLETMYAYQTNINRVVKIFESLLTRKQGDLPLQPHFARLKALIQEVNLCQPPTIDPMTLMRYREELYGGIYLSWLCPSKSSQIQGSLLSSDHVPILTTIFSVTLRVTTSASSSPLSSALSDMTHPLAMMDSSPRARYDGLPPHSDGGRPHCGFGHNSYLPCPYCIKKNHLAHKCWKQFGKRPTTQAVVTPLATLSPALIVTPTPYYHVTLMSVEYDELRRSRSTDASSSACLASLSAPLTLGTSAHLVSSSPPWIINLRASPQMIRTSSLLS